MLTDVISLWEELSRECDATGQTMERLVRPDSDFEIVLRKGEHGCSLIVGASTTDKLATSTKIPACMTCALDRSRGSDAIQIALRNMSYEPIFIWFSQDLANRLIDRSASEAEEVLEQCLAEWSEAFRVVPDSGMRRQAQQGLFAELLFLESILMAKDVDSGILAWNSQNSVHDFQIGATAWEVKSFGGRREEVRISSEDQLDCAGLESLILVVVSLKVSDKSGTTLSEIVDRLFSFIGKGTDLDLHFRTGLAKYGYVDEASIHETFYFTPRTLAQYQVDDDFPRITGSSLPSAIHNVKYALSLSSLEHHVAEPTIHYDQ
jgi:hypothetical protein